MSTDIENAVHRLADPDRDVRQTAALELGGLEDPVAAPALVARLWSEPDFFVRETLTWAVARVDAAATPLLLDALHADDDSTRVRALHALSKIADPATTAAMLPLTDDPSPDVAATARWALTRTGDPRAVAVLAAQLGVGDDDRRNSLTREIASFGEAAVPAVTAALSSLDPAVREHAVDVLCLVGSPGAEGAVTALGAALSDDDERVRLSAVMALRELRSPAARTAFAEARQAEDPRVRAIAARGGAPHGGSDSQGSTSHARQQAGHDFKADGAAEKSV